MADFKFNLDDQVIINGSDLPVVIFGRCTWETKTHPEPVNYYEFRGTDAHAGIASEVEFVGLAQSEIEQG